MRLITSTDLAAKRRVHDWQLPDTGSVLRAPEAYTSGGSSRDWDNPTTVASGEPCHYTEEPQTDAEREIAGRIAAPAVGRVEWRAFTDVQEADRVRITINGTLLGDFEVRWSSGRVSWEIGVTTLVTAVV